MHTFTLWNLIKESLDSTPKINRLPDIPREESSVVAQLQQAVTGYEALANATAPVNCEPLPPKYDQNTELLHLKYEQGLLEEKQYCEKDFYENKQHGVQHGAHGICSVQNGDQEELASLEFELEREGPTRPSSERPTRCFNFLLKSYVFS